MPNVSDALARRGVPPNEIIKIEEANTWRVVLYDQREGVVVLDIEASNEAEAKGKANSAAREHLKCENIMSATALNWVELPDAWKRINAPRY